MRSSRVATKKPATKEGAAKKAVAKKAAPKAVPKKAAPKKAARAGPARAAPKPAKAAAPAPEAAPAKKAAAKRPPGAPRVEKTRVVIPMDVYEPRKDEIKAPLKAQALKWNFLGEGKGLYKRPDGGVHCFTQFRDDGVHYSVWGDDKKAVGEVLAAWRALLGEAGWASATASGEQATAAEAQQKESEEMRLWKLAEPQPRPGEPDFFFKKRVAEWQAKKPA